MNAEQKIAKAWLHDRMKAKLHNVGSFRLRNSDY